MAIRKLGKRSRRIGTVVGTGMGVAALMFVSTGVAQASSNIMYDNYWTGYHQCDAILRVQINPATGHDEAQAEAYESVYDTNYNPAGAGGDCFVLMMESYNGGPFRGVTDVSNLPNTGYPGGTAYTQWFNDGPAYKNYACAEDVTTGNIACTPAY